MKAIARYEYLNVKDYSVIEGEVVCTVFCADYDDYKLLPAAIEVGGQILGRTGWNSDLQYACYKSNTRLAKRII